VIFLNLSQGAPPDFKNFSARFHPYLKPHRLDRAKIAARCEYPTAANWKLVFENFSECYHCRPAHKTYCSVHDPLKLLAMGAGPGSGDEELTARYAPVLEVWERATRAKGYFTGTFFDDAISPYMVKPQHYSMGRPLRTTSQETRPAP
jgi:phenylpropionate dioxygenase-like ring-hydroxylating dioxygenase large terminal subunit